MMRFFLSHYLQIPSFHPKKRERYERSTQALLENSSKRNVSEEILSFDEYLQLVQQEPWVTRDTFQLLRHVAVFRGRPRN